MEQKLFSVSIDKEFNVFSKEFNHSIYLRVYTSLFTAGIVKDLKPTNFTVLLAVAAYMDEQGNCYPTQRQISDITGLSKTTVNKSIGELLEFKVNDVPVLKRKFVQEGKYKNSYYTVNPISQIAIFDGEIAELSDKESSTCTNSRPDEFKNLVLNNNQTTISSNKKIGEPGVQEFKTPKDIIAYFSEKYREQYGVNYNISSFPKMAGIVKRGLLNKGYTDQQIKTMIDVSISEYDKRWKKPSYPRPTLNALCSWLGDTALAIAEDSSKEYEELAALTSDSDSETDDVLAKFGIEGV